VAIMRCELLTYGSKTCAYQDSGELLSRTDTATGETTLFDYSTLGHLRRVTLPSGVAVDYVVDGLGRCVGKRSCARSPEGAGSPREAAP
jgi:hypothetical protein